MCADDIPLLDLVDICTSETTTDTSDLQKVLDILTHEKASNKIISIFQKELSKSDTQNDSNREPSKESYPVVSPTCESEDMIYYSMELDGANLCIQMWSPVSESGFSEVDKTGQSPQPFIHPMLDTSFSSALD